MEAVMKKLIFVILLFTFYGCITTGQHIYVTSAHIETIDGRLYNFQSAEIFRNEWITVIKEPKSSFKIANKDIKYISVTSYFVKKGIHFDKPYIEKQF